MKIPKIIEEEVGQFKNDIDNYTLELLGRFFKSLKNVN